MLSFPKSLCTLKHLCPSLCLQKVSCKAVLSCIGSASNYFTAWYIKSRVLLKPGECFWAAEWRNTSTNEHIYMGTLREREVFSRGLSFALYIPINFMWEETELGVIHLEEASVCVHVWWRGEDQLPETELEEHRSLLLLRCGAERVCHRDCGPW